MDSGQTATRLDKLQKIGGIGNWELDLATGKAVWSEGACRIFGLEPTNNIISQSEWVTFVHPADREMVVQAFKRSLATPQNYEVQYRIIRPDGSLRHVYAHVEFIITDGKPTGLYGRIDQGFSRVAGRPGHIPPGCQGIAGEHRQHRKKNERSIGCREIM